MRLLLDTQVLLWWRRDDARLGADARALFAAGQHELLWSAASSLEIAIKASIGRLRVPRAVSAWLPAVIDEEGLTPLPVLHKHAHAVADLPLHHRDPFDRLVVAQAIVEGVALLTSDAILKRYPVECVSATT